MHTLIIMSVDTHRIFVGATEFGHHCEVLCVRLTAVTGCGVGQVYILLMEIYILLSVYTLRTSKTLRNNDIRGIYIMITPIDVFLRVYQYQCRKYFSTIKLVIAENQRKESMYFIITNWLDFKSKRSNLPWITFWLLCNVPRKCAKLASSE